MTREIDDPRRRTLIQLLAAGFFSGASTGVGSASAQFFGRTPNKLPDGRSIYRVSGNVSVDNRRATLQTRIEGGSRIQTGSDGELVYAVGESAYIARANTEIVVETSTSDSSVVTGLKLLAGKLLSVFPSHKPVQIETNTMTIGIRGTGVYLETDPELSYFCTCYGTTDVAANGDPESRLTVAAVQHDRPVYVLANAPAGQRIRNAPLINHTDQELMLIEALVGREPPFSFPLGAYASARRHTY